MFGANIDKTLGKVSGNGPKLVGLSLTIHKLDGAPEKALGIEVTTTSVGSYHMTPVALSMTEAKKLRDILDEGIGDRQST